MNLGRTVFSQLIAFTPNRDFRRCAARYGGDYRRTHRNSEADYWQAVSIDKQFEPGSMQSRFMTGAASSTSAGVR